jgi:hypothetical protein
LGHFEVLLTTLLQLYSDPLNHKHLWKSSAVFRLSKCTTAYHDFLIKTYFLFFFAVTFSGEQKPSPLVLTSPGPDEKTSDSSLPSTPFMEQNTPKLHQAQSFDVSSNFRFMQHVLLCCNDGVGFRNAI